ncbi:TRAP transporter small permease [Rhodovibrionaceae bacterium A322]
MSDISEQQKGESPSPGVNQPAWPFRLMRQAVVAWALLGGVLLLALMAVTALSVVLDLLFDKPLAGDFELVQLGCALAVFAFLPYCQMTRGHIAVDIFTMRASRPFQRAVEILSLFLMFALGLLLLWRMWLGGWDYYDPTFAESTPILGIAIWQVFPPILLSLLLMTLVTAVMLIEVITGRDLGFEGPRLFGSGGRS